MIEVNLGFPPTSAKFTSEIIAADAREAASRDAGLCTALVTGSGRRRIDHHLQRLGLADSFDIIVARGDAPSNNPDPAPYRLALHPLGTIPGPGHLPRRLTHRRHVRHVQPGEVQSGVNFAGDVGCLVAQAQPQGERERCRSDAAAPLRGLCPVRASLSAAARGRAGSGKSGFVDRGEVGAWTPAAVKVAAEMGMTSIHWDVVPRDWDRPGAQTISDLVTTYTRPGSIVLLHDGGGDRSQTVEACRLMLPALKSRLQLIPLPPRA